MGYKNEFASPNKYSELEKYYNKNIKGKIIPIVDKFSEDSKITSIDKFKNLYTSEMPLNIPCAGFDGGIAILFPSELHEVKVLKVASGCSEDDLELFKKNHESFIHIFTGKFKWLFGTNQELKDVIDELLEIVMSNKVIIDALNILKINKEEFRNHLYNKIFKFKGKAIEDNIREIFELSALIVFNENNKKNKTLVDNQKNKNNPIPFMLIKDGTLFPNGKTVTGLFADAVSSYLNNSNNYVIGVVKASRFVNQDNSWSKIIKNRAKSIDSHTFFQLDESFEEKIDEHSRNLPYIRYFLTLFGGNSIYEIQIPKYFENNTNELHNIFNALTSQISFLYGGSIITNSYAHQNASLSEFEAKILSKAENEILNDIIKNDEYKQSKEVYLDKINNNED